MPGVSLKAAVCNFQKRKARGRASREDPEGPAQFGCQTSFCTLGPWPSSERLPGQNTNDSTKPTAFGTDCYEATSVTKKVRTQTPVQI